MEYNKTKYVDNTYAIKIPGIYPIEFCRVCNLWARSKAHGSASDCSYWHDNPDLVKIANAKLLERIYSGKIIQ